MPSDDQPNTSRDPIKPSALDYKAADELLATHYADLTSGRDAKREFLARSRAELGPDTFDVLEERRRPRTVYERWLDQQDPDTLTDAISGTAAISLAKRPVDTSMVEDLHRELVRKLGRLISLLARITEEALHNRSDEWLAGLEEEMEEAWEDVAAPPSMFDEEIKTVLNFFAMLQEPPHAPFVLNHYSSSSAHGLAIDHLKQSAETWRSFRGIAERMRTTDQPVSAIPLAYGGLINASRPVRPGDLLDPMLEETRRGRVMLSPKSRG
jgi:hypothetical protein